MRPVSACLHGCAQRLHHLQAAADQLRRRCPAASQSTIAGGGSSTVPARSAVLDAGQGRQERGERRQRSPLPGSRPPMTLRASSRGSAGYFNAVQVFPFSPGALYQIYAAPRTDHRYRARARRAAHGFGAGVGRRHRALGRRRHRKRKRRHQTRPYHGQADTAFDRDQSRRQHRPAHLSHRAALA